MGAVIKAKGEPKNKNMNIIYQRLEEEEWPDLSFQASALRKRETRE